MNNVCMYLLYKEEESANRVTYGHQTFKKKKFDHSHIFNTYILIKVQKCKEYIKEEMFIIAVMSIMPNPQKMLISIYEG